MNASQLKARILAANTASHFFDFATMRHFGDTMRNYGVRVATIRAYTKDFTGPEPRKVYELYRRQPVKHGLQTSHFWDMDTFEEVREVRT